MDLDCANASLYSHDWKSLKHDFISEQITDYKNHFEKLSYYDLVEVLVDQDGRPKKLALNDQEVPSFVVFTTAQLAARVLKTLTLDELKNDQYTLTLDESAHLKTYMLGDLVQALNDPKKILPIKVNPVHCQTSQGPRLLAEEFIFIPLLDQVTNKYLITDPEDALALLAIQPEDQMRMGMELVFYALTNRLLPYDKESRGQILREKIEELAFVAPRIPMRKGSGTFICVLLNLENSMEEAAFIRKYRTFDSHTDLIFVTSELEILTGELERIAYDGDSIDTIFLPLINWQKRQKKA